MQKMQELDQGNDNTAPTGSFSTAPTDVPRQTTRPQNRTVVQTPAQVPTSRNNSSVVPPLSHNSAPSQAYAPGQDNNSQNAARAALMQKMQELNQQDNVPTEVPAVTPRSQNNTFQNNSSTIPPLSHNSAPSQAYAPGQDNDAQTAARAALMQKMQALDVQDMNNQSMNTPGQVNPATGLAPDGSVVQAAPAAHPRLPEPFFEPAPEITETPQQQMQRQQRSAKRRTFSPFQSQKTPVVQVDNYGFAPIQAPAAPVSSDKEVALRALLAKYRADELSPAEYQAERARIIREP